MSRHNTRITLCMWVPVLYQQQALSHYGAEGGNKTSLRVSLKLSHVKSYWECLRLLWSPYGCWGQRREHASTSSGASFYFRPIFFLHGPTQLLPDSSSSSRTALPGLAWPAGTRQHGPMGLLSHLFFPQGGIGRRPLRRAKRPLTVCLGLSDLTAGGDWSTASLPSHVPRSPMDTLMSPVKYSQVPLPETRRRTVPRRGGAGM